jgi:initiation factor 1A
MPNQKGGKKFKKNKKMNFQVTKELILKNPKEKEEYGRIESAKGNGRFDIILATGNKIIGIVRGKDRKRMWINRDDVVLVGLWDFQTTDNKCSILHKYEEHDITRLLEKKEITSQMLQRENDFKDTECDADDIFSTEIPISDEEESKTDESDIDLDDI